MLVWAFLADALGMVLILPVVARMLMERSILEEAEKSDRDLDPVGPRRFTWNLTTFFGAGPGLDHVPFKGTGS